MHGLTDAAIISGKAPLLLGRPTLKKLGMGLNFKSRLGFAEIPRLLEFPESLEAPTFQIKSERLAPKQKQPKTCAAWAANTDYA